MDKPAPADRPILDLLRRRWSARAIDPALPVDRGTVLTLLEAARWAPSSFNEQPWRFLVFDGTDQAALEEARACLTAGNAWAKRAPVLLLSVAVLNFRKDGSRNRHAEHDVGLATENLLLEATALGLVAHPMAGFDAERAVQAFGIAEGCWPLAMIAVGQAGGENLLDEKTQRKQAAPRVRRPISELAFEGRWGKPYFLPD